MGTRVALTYAALHPDRQPETIRWYETVLQFMLDHADDPICQCVLPGRGRGTLAASDPFGVAVIEDREEYLEGTFKQEFKTIDNEIILAKENERRAEEYLKYSELLAVKGYVTPLQVESDRFAVEKAKNELALALGKMTVLEGLTKKKMLINK